MQSLRLIDQQAESSVWVVSFLSAEHPDGALRGFTPVEIGRIPLSTAAARAITIHIRRA
jgi:hypothetical protein